MARHVKYASLVSVVVGEIGHLFVKRKASSCCMLKASYTPAHEGATHVDAGRKPSSEGYSVELGKTVWVVPHFV